MCPFSFGFIKEYYFYSFSRKFVFNKNVGLFRYLCSHILTFNFWGMISVNGVSVVFGGFYLLDTVSFLINKKDRIGLTGRNGAGKSTTLKMLAGLQAPSEGNISMASDIRIGYLCGGLLPYTQEQEPDCI